MLLQVLNKKEQISSALIEVINNQFATYTKRKKHSHIKNALEKITENDNCLLVIAKKDNVIAGFAFGNLSVGLESGGYYFWLNEIFVEPSFRRLGVGSGLLNYVKKWAQERGCKYFCGITDKNNPGGLDFYKKEHIQCEEVIWLDTDL